MIGYRPPASTGQLPPEPHDDEVKRQAAEDYSKRRRVRTLTTWLIAVVLIAALAYFVVQLAIHLL